MTLHDFVALYTREHANTRTQLHAFPADKFQFKPHERSNSAHQLGWTFVVEEVLMLKALTNEPVPGGGFPPAPATWAEVLDAFGATHVKVLAAAGSANEATLKPVTFFVAPKQTGDYSKPKPRVPSASKTSVPRLLQGRMGGLLLNSDPANACYRPMT